MAEYGVTFLGIGREVLRDLGRVESVEYRVHVGGRTAPYWHYVENGTVHTRPQPFIEPTLAMFTFFKAQEILQDSRTVEEAVSRMAHWVADEYRRRVPVRTGDLRDSVTVERTR